MTKSKSDKTPLDWSLAPRGTVSATAQAAAGIVAVSGVGEVVGVHPAYGLAAAGIGAVGHLVAGAHRAYTPSAVLYRLACWAGAGGWLTWALASDAPWWDVNGLATLAVGAVGAGMMAPLANRRGEGGGRSALVLRSTARVSEEWEARFRRVCQVSVTVTAIRPWPTGAGYDVHGKLPPGGATLSALRSRCEALATDADLPIGCGVEIEPGESRATFVAHVSTVNRLEAETIPYPEDYSPTSIYDPIDLGEHRNSSVARVLLREDSVVVIGQKRSGKTNTLDVITTGVGRCRDAVVMHIDLNGGGVSQAWLHPWLTGQTERPAVTWAAASPEEALYLTTAALAIAKHRKSAYREFKVNSDSKLLRLSAELPEIVIVVDEAAESMGTGAHRDPILRQVRANLEEIQRIGGNEGVNVVLSGLRATQDVISPAVIKQSRVRIGMLVQDQEELAYLFGWQHRDAIDPADLSGKGTGFIATGSQTPAPFKAYFMTPSQITRAAIAIANQRPELDPASAEVADGEFELDLGGPRTVTVKGLYSSRYERMRAAFTGQDVPEVNAAPAARPAPAAPAADTAHAPRTRPPLRLVSAHDWPDLRATAAESQPPRLADANTWPNLGATTPAPATTTTATATSERPADPAAAELEPAPPAQVPEILARALAAFDAAQDDRMHSEALAEALGMESAQALAEALRPYGVQPRPPFVRDGLKRRGYWKADIAAAAQAEPATSHG